MKLPALKFPTIKLPMIGLGKARPSAGLVLRETDVELLWMEGKQVGGQIRIPVEGTGTEALTQAIQQAVAGAKLKGKRLAVSLLNPDILTRFFTMPMLPKAEWETAAQFEARKYLPFKIEGLAWDCYILPSTAVPHLPSSETARSHNLEVVFSAIPRERLNDLLVALTAAGIQPTRIEPLSFSLARAASAAPGISEQEFVCLVDIRQGRAHLVMARGGIPYLTRDVNFSGGSKEGEAVEAAFDVQLQQMVSELSLSMDFFIREYPGARIARVLLLGEQEVVQRWYQRLGEHVRCPVALGNELLVGIESNLPLSFVAAAGLLRNGKNDNASLDLLKRNMATPPSAAAGPRVRLPEMNETLAELRRPQTIVGALVALAAPIVLSAVLGGQLASTAQARFDQATRATSGVNSPISSMGQEMLQSVQTQVKQQLALLKQMVAGRMGVAARLDALARSLPEGVWITSLSFEDRLEATGDSQVQMTVGGACFLGVSGQEFTAIQTFEERFKHNPALLKGFMVAQLDQINAQTDGQRHYTYRTFRLNCHSNRKL